MGLPSAYGLKYLENSFFFWSATSREGGVRFVFFFKKKNNPQKTLQ